MTAVGGRRWAFGTAEKRGAKYYREEAFDKPETNSRLRKADRQLMEAGKCAWQPNLENEPARATKAAEPSQIAQADPRQASLCPLGQIKKT
jgi:hypothetical protein